MDEIQSYSPHSAAPSHLRAAAPLAVNPAIVKTPSNYLNALRRRVWVVLAIAMPLSIVACIYILRMAPVYLIKAEIEINPPEYDPALTALVSRDIGRRDPASGDRYIPNRAAQLKSSRLLERVVRDSAIWPEVSQYEDPAAELFRTLTYTPVQKNGNIYIVTLEGSDAARTKKLLETLLRYFQKDAKTENGEKTEATRDYAKDNQRELEGELKQLDVAISDALKFNSTIGPGGKSIIEEQYVNLGTIMTQKQLRLGELSQQMMIADQFPRIDMSGESASRSARLAELEREKRKGVKTLEHFRKVIRNYNNDSAVMAYSDHLSEVLDEIDDLRSIGAKAAPNPTGLILEQYQKELDADKDLQRDLLKKMQETHPAHQRILTMMEERRDKAKRVSDMKASLTEFGILSNSVTQPDFIKIPGSLVEPTTPTRPNRPMLIAISLVMSFGLGIGLVCLLEHIDHSVKVPEHASHGLTLPLLGVVPRIRRTALTQRGRHLWTPGAAESLASDAYRNIRASLLGIADRMGPIVTLLVTSAKAGEGKSTTALNLAATCALAGERTLLLDIDFRRPTLAEVFIEDEDWQAAPGVVDVLRGEIPWQRTLRHTRIPNLDFIPTGDTRETPIEILGTLELRQFLLALSHHYDRVILDGPAVLGLADCRFLGRIVDASMLVVRSGSHHLMTLHRAKAMLEQSHVAIAGVVFNGLTEDLQNWSSYGYGDETVGGGRFEAASVAEGALSFAGRG
ncbi:MAG: polysaccharide biosynthesis tyrosine autokinase [Isosphaeraceae bacterium]